MTRFSPIVDEDTRASLRITNNARHFQVRMHDSIDKIIHDIDRLIHEIKEISTRRTQSLSYARDSIREDQEIEDDLKSLMSMKVFVMRLKSKY